MNTVCLVGRLVRDPESRVTNTGAAVAEFSVAVDKTFGKKEGEPDAFFFRVKAFGKQAEFASNYLTKGRLVSVSGRLEQRRYQGSDGAQREAIEVIADSVRGLGGVPDTKPGDAHKPAQEDDYDPFADE